MLAKIRSKYLLRVVLDLIKLNHKLKLIKYSKKIQKDLEINKNNYKEYIQIIIELISENDKDLSLTEKNIFINFISESHKGYYHIYFNDNLKQEINRNYFTKNEKIKKIKIYIDNPISSLKNIFSGCKIIKEINFINFNRKNINDMSGLFKYCSSLEKINFNSFNTENVTNMNYMFYQCIELKELDLTSFNTKNVINMQKMFFECRELKKIILSKNFTVNKVIDFSYFFHKCYYLNDIDISNFIFNKDADVKHMFDYCSKKLIEKIKKQNKILKKKLLFELFFNSVKN